MILQLVQEIQRVYLTILNVLVKIRFNCLCQSIGNSNSNFNEMEEYFPYI